MTLSRWGIPLLFVVILGLPMLLSRRPSDAASPAGEPAEALIIITPHVPQIREEFGRAFSDWHRRTHGAPVRVDFRVVGGTSEILRALQARYTAAVAAGQFEVLPGGEVRMEPGAVDFDIMFGGGTYDHGRLKSGVTVATNVEGRSVDLRVPMSVPAGFGRETLLAWFGENAIGPVSLYDDEQYWIGTALSGFGIVYNRDLTRELLDRDDLDSFEDMADPRLAGWVAIADPRQSGSITTTMESILSNYGWDRGWRALRAMAANARYFTNSSSKVPIDVSQGEAAAGLAIDFYGRTQSQIVMRDGETPETARVGYVDPAGEVSIDPDPVSILRGGPNPEVARRFVEFCLSDEGQALWNFPAVTGPRGADNPRTAEGLPLGPQRFELRRMPIKREFYHLYSHHLIDKVDPYTIASDVATAGWRSAIGLMFGAFGIENHGPIGEAWVAMREARARGVDEATLDRAEELFFAFPTGEQVERLWASLFGAPDPGSERGVRLPAAALLPFTPENYAAIRGSWRDPRVEFRLAIVYTQAFAENYRHVADMLENAPRTADAAR